MRKLIFSTLVLGVLFGSFSFINAQKSPEAIFAVLEENPTPEELVKWEQKVFQFGEIVQGVAQKATFTFTNTSEEVMTITTVKPSCGCTTGSYPKEPLAPGESGEIELVYNAKSLGNFTKTATVITSLSETPMRLTIKGKVVK